MVHSGDLHIGGATVNGDDCGFRGLIREARIYKRAQTHSEIKTLPANAPLKNTPVQCAAS
jgi:hypothetical protein